MMTADYSRSIEDVSGVVVASWMHFINHRLDEKVCCPTTYFKAIFDRLAQPITYLVSCEKAL